MLFAAFKLSPGFWLPLLAWLGLIEIPDPVQPPPPPELPVVMIQPMVPAGYEIHCRDSDPMTDPFQCLLALPRSVRIVPHFANGRALGFKLYAIRPNSLYAQAGLRNGDILRTINGYDLTTPDKALELYVRIKEADVLRLEILRQGRPLTLRYCVR